MVNGVSVVGYDTRSDAESCVNFAGWVAYRFPMNYSCSRGVMVTWRDMGSSTK